MIYDMIYDIIGYDMIYCLYCRLDKYAATRPNWFNKRRIL